ncbi:M56 family metallopeptidase [Shivajiella indica]|uniref:M56 family metallopeptidase n=1 Tax=Shivajiella indica TaxID=872115 RepID=A0ABW5BAR5_9BACT
MEIFQNFIPEHYLYALGWMIIHALWQITGIGLLLWLALRTFNHQSAAFKYRLSISALLIVTLLSIGTFILKLDGQEVTYRSNLTEEELTYLLSNPEILNLKKAGIEPTPDWIIISKRIEKWIPTLVNIWFVGALLFFVRMASGMADLRQLHHKKHTAVNTKWSDFIRLQQEKLKISRLVKLLSSIHIDMPLTYGVLKPVILVPSALLLHLSPAQLEAIITHELAHVKRHDYLINLFQTSLEVVFFFHPIFWWINKEIKEQRENACDELVIKTGISAKDLAHGLANVLNQAQHHVPEMAMAAAKRTTPTLDRIKKIMGVKTSPTQPTTLTTLTMIITLLLGATLMVGAYDNETLKDSNDKLTTESNTKTLDLDFEISKPNGLSDTIPPKKSPYIYLDSIQEMPLSPEEWEKIQKQLEPLKEMGMLFKDLDFEWGDFSAMPKLDLKEIPMPNFNFDNMPKWEMDPEVWQKMIPDSTLLKGMHIPNFSPTDFAGIHENFAAMSKEEREKYNQEFKEKMAAWKEANAENLAKWKEEMKVNQEEWKKKFEPQMKEFQMKMKEWEKSNQPLIEEYQTKIKAWEKENQPQIEEFQKKMEEWQKANEEKMKEFHKKMEEWQKEHQKELEELKKNIRESVKNIEN